MQTLASEYKKLAGRSPSGTWTEATLKRKVQELQTAADEAAAAAAEKKAAEQEAYDLVVAERKARADARSVLVSFYTDVPEEAAVSHPFAHLISRARATIARYAEAQTKFMTRLTADPMDALTWGDEFVTLAARKEVADSIMADYLAGLTEEEIQKWLMRHLLTQSVSNSSSTMTRVTSLARNEAVRYFLCDLAGF